MSNVTEAGADAPAEVFLEWYDAQSMARRLAREPRLPATVLRRTGFMDDDLVERVRDWYEGAPMAEAARICAGYLALERETAQLYATILASRRAGGLGVRVTYVRSDREPYDDADALCAELRGQRSMTLRTIAADAPHPLLGGEQGGVVDQLRVVHDVFGHAALGLGFDVQSEFGTWLQCRTLFSEHARDAAFCELVGAVTTFIATGTKPALRADPPPDALTAACQF